MNPHRLDLVSLSLFSLVVRTGSIGKGAELAPRAVGAASKRSTQAPRGAPPTSRTRSAPRRSSTRSAARPADALWTEDQYTAS